MRQDGIRIVSPSHRAGDAPAHNMIRIVKMQDLRPLQSTVLGGRVGGREALWMALMRAVCSKKYHGCRQKRGIWTPPEGTGGMVH